MWARARRAVAPISGSPSSRSSPPGGARSPFTASIRRRFPAGDDINEGAPMTPPAFPVLDADGHVTATTEQLARYLDEPYRRRPLTLPFYTWDGWERRLL